MDSALEGNQAGGAIFSAQFLAASQRAEAKKALKDIQERHVEILKLEESLRVWSFSPPFPVVPPS